MKTKDILINALELLETKGWCKGTFALNAEGGGVSVDSSEAASFCALGAIHRVAGVRRTGDAYHYSKAEETLNKFIPTPSAEGLRALSAFNDDPNTKFEDIRLVFQEAIADTEV